VLQFAKNPFDGIPISSATHLKSEASPVKSSLEVLSAVDEKFGGFDVVFFSKFAQENLRE